MIKILQQFIVALLAYAFLGLLFVLPLEVASRFCGWVFALVGPLLPRSRRSLFNIAYAMPETTPAEQRRINKEAWRNFGCVMGEFLHSNTLIHSERITFEGLDYLKKNKKGGILVGAHLANWEIGSAGAQVLGYRVSAGVRSLNNPFLRGLLNSRLKNYAQIYEKGIDSVRGINQALKRGEYFALLADQKLREGMMLPFFGYDATTPVAHIKLAKKYKVPMFMVQVIRKPGCRFVIRISPFDLSGNNIATIGKRMNATMEKWIRENPEQWLWFHRRWPESKSVK